jgi:nitronate monooxygenase
MDAVSIDSFESAGHIGQEDVAAFVHIPLAVDAVKIPVMACGGIADARGFVAALALGAEGIVMGTRFMVSKEIGLHPKIAEAMLKAEGTDTMLIERSLRNTARVLKTEYCQKILEMEQKGATLEQLLPLISGRLEEKALQETGDTNSSVIHVGQVVGLIHEVLSVKEIIDNIISEATVVAKRLHKMGISI